MMKRNGVLTKEEIIEVARQGNYIFPDEVNLYEDVNGNKAKEYLESKGFKVIKNYQASVDVGLAITECGIYLKTNGFIFKSIFS